MKDTSSSEPNSCLAEYLKEKFAEENDCPMYEGPKSLEESDASHFMVPMQNGMGFCRVRREAIESGVPDDDTLFDEALVGGIEYDLLEELERLYFRRL